MANISIHLYSSCNLRKLRAAFICGLQNTYEQEQQQQQQQDDAAKQITLRRSKGIWQIRTGKDKRFPARDPWNKRDKCIFLDGKPKSKQAVLYQPQKPRHDAAVNGAALQREGYIAHYSQSHCASLLEIHLPATTDNASLIPLFDGLPVEHTALIRHSSIPKLYSNVMAMVALPSQIIKPLRVYDRQQRRKAHSKAYSGIHHPVKAISGQPLARVALAFIVLRRALRKRHDWRHKIHAFPEFDMDYKPEQQQMGDNGQPPMRIRSRPVNYQEADLIRVEGQLYYWLKAEACKPVRGHREVIIKPEGHSNDDIKAIKLWSGREDSPKYEEPMDTEAMYILACQRLPHLMKYCPPGEGPRASIGTSPPDSGYGSGSSSRSSSPEPKFLNDVATEERHCTRCCTHDYCRQMRDRWQRATEMYGAKRMKAKCTCKRSMPEMQRLFKTQMNECVGGGKYEPLFWEAKNDEFLKEGYEDAEYGQYWKDMILHAKGYTPEQIEAALPGAVVD